MPGTSEGLQEARRYQGKKKNDAPLATSKSMASKPGDGKQDIWNKEGVIDVKAEDKKEKPAMDKEALREKYEAYHKQKLRDTLDQRLKEGSLDKQLKEGPKPAPDPVPEPVPEKVSTATENPGEDEAGSDDRMSSSSEESESENPAEDDLQVGINEKDL